MTRRVSKKQKVEKLEFVQDFLPIKNLSNGIIAVSYTHLTLPTKA